MDVTASKVIAEARTGAGVGSPASSNGGAVPIFEPSSPASNGGSEVPDVALPGCPRATAAEVGMDPRPLDELEECFKKSVDKGELPGLAYAILKDGKLVRASALGVQDVETRQPWRFDTLCRLYSMTKTVAVITFMSLVEEGRVSLDDPVSKYLPAFGRHVLQVVHNEEVTRKSEENLAPSQEVTIMHLLTHSSGLAYGPAMGDESSCSSEECYRQLMEKVDSGEVGTLEQYVQELAELPVRFQPGERWEYSYSIDVLGRIIELVSGKRLDQCFSERVLEPLGLHDTRFSLPKAKCGRLASFYRKRGEGNDILECVDNAASSRWDEEKTSGRVLSAGGTVGTVAGGLVSSLNDFTRLCLMIQNEGELDGVRVLRQETVQQMSRNLLPEVTGKQDVWCLETAGLGFGVLGSVAVPHPDSNWYDPPGEIGWGGLAGTAWAVDHRERLVVVTMCQVMYEMWIDEEARKSARLALGYVPPPEPSETSEVQPEAAPAQVQEPQGASEPATAGSPQPAPADTAAAEPAGGLASHAWEKQELRPASPERTASRPPEAQTPPTTSERAAAKRAAPDDLPVGARETLTGKKLRLSHETLGMDADSPDKLEPTPSTPLGERSAGTQFLLQAC